MTHHLTPRAWLRATAQNADPLDVRQLAAAVTAELDSLTRRVRNLENAGREVVKVTSAHGAIYDEDVAIVALRTLLYGDRR